MRDLNKSKKLSRRLFLTQSAVSVAALPLMPVDAIAGDFLNGGKTSWPNSRPKNWLHTSSWAEGGTKSMIAPFPPRDPFASGLGNTCTLQEQTIIGPCYFDNVTTKDDISEGQPGVPMAVVLKLTDLNCRPIRGANIEIWWANAFGVYSGDSSNATNGVVSPEEALALFGPNGLVIDPDSLPDFEIPTQEVSPFIPSECTTTAGEEQMEIAMQSRYFRGNKVTNHRGDVFYKGCFPGWYRGRAPHVHVRVTIDGKQWVYQLGFDNEIARDIYLNHPEYTGVEQDTSNEDDLFFSMMGGVENHQLEMERQFDGSMLIYKALQIDV